MAKLKYDASGIEPGYRGDMPKPGVYRARIVEITDEQPEGKERRLHVVAELTSEAGDAAGYRFHEYINMKGKPGGVLIPQESVAWKWRQLVDALGLRAKGIFDTENVSRMSEFNVRTRIEPARDGYEERGRIAAMLPLAETEADADNGDEADEPTQAPARRGRRAAAAPAPEPEPEEDEGEDYSGWEDADLIAELEERELDVPMVGRGSRKKLDHDKAIETLEEADAEGGDGEDGETAADDEDEAEDYTTWELADLKEELKERGLKTTGPKAVLIRRIEEDDKANPFE